MNNRWSTKAYKTEGIIANIETNVNTDKFQQNIRSITTLHSIEYKYIYQKNF